MKDRIKADSVTALKNHDQARVDVLRFLISIIDKKALLLPPGAMTEAEELAVLRKELKNKEESREMFVKGNRDDLVSQMDYEIKVLQEYLPAGLTDEDLEKIVDETIKELGNNFGLVMKTVITKVAGRVGGDKIAPMVKQKISNQ